MAQMPPGAPGSVTPASGGISPGASAGLSFIANLAFSYVLGRFTAQDGPRLDNLQASGGDYGTPMARGYGSGVRVTGAFIAQDDIEETKHKIGSKGIATIAGAVGGAAQGFMIGGPIGAVIGGAIGGLLGFASPNQYYYTYSCTFAVFLIDRTDDNPAENLLKIWAGGKLIFNNETVTSETFGSDGRLIKRKYKKNKYFKSVTFYTGHTEQNVDPILAAEVNEEVGYVYSCYVVIEDLQLDTWGNVVPTSEHLVQPASNQSLADCVEQIVTVAGIDPLREISTTALTASVMEGYLIPSESTCWDAIKPLLPAFAFDAAEVSGSVRFFKRSQFMRSTISLSQMGAHEYGEQPGPEFTYNRAADVDLPKETSLTFIDPNRDYQPNTMTSRRSEGDARSNVSTQILLTMQPSAAASAVSLMHWDAWLGRSSARFNLMDNWNSLAVGHAYGLPVDDEVVPFRISRRTRGANGVIEVEAISDESIVYTANVTGTSGLPPDEPDTGFADTRLVFIDGAIHEDGHDDYGFYIAMAGTANDWPRALVQASGDGGATWADIFDQPGECVMGDVALAIGAGTTSGLDDTLDATTVVTVIVLHDGMIFTNATDAQLDAHANMFWLGKDGFGEYIQFKTATQTAERTWQLTNLRRGRRGSDWAMATHVAAEELVMLGDGGIFRLSYSDTSQWGVPMKFRGVTLHQDEVDAAIIDVENSGEGKRPFSPINVEGTWDGSFNLTATFDHRPRMFDGSLGVDDNFEFDVEILNATPVRTIVVTAETFGYTAAQQTSDGLTPGDTVIGRVRQTSDVYDGRWRNFTLIGPNAALMLEDDTTFLHLEDDAGVFELG